ncbi:MAG: Uma2 family endonuclease [Armatimonadetes bacterium]|nr:Uma2 family endonuclease [Armatimonadota bacterium]
MRTEGKAEIIYGRIQHFDMTGYEPMNAGGNIYGALKSWIRQTGATGKAATDGAGFLCNLPHRQSFSPDASYYTGELPGMKFLPEPPTFAVEVRSEGDYGTAAERDMKDKRADYFATGSTEVVWDVDLLSPDAVVRKFTKTGGAEKPVVTFQRGETADAEPAVPGFSMPVDDLFE